MNESEQSWVSMSSAGIIISVLLSWGTNPVFQWCGTSSMSTHALLFLTSWQELLYDGWPGSDFDWCLPLLLFRWWPAAQQCVSAPQRLRSALRVLAWCQMDVDAVRCVRHSSTRTAAPRDPVTTTKGWSVTTATTWRWPGVFVEVKPLISVASTVAYNTSIGQHLQLYTSKRGYFNE